MHYNLIFRSARQITYFVLFALWLCISITELGLVSQQIHRFGGRFRADWPTQEYGHAMGLLLFTSIISLLFGLFHWALSLFLYLPIFLVSPPRLDPKHWLSMLTRRRWAYGGALERVSLRAPPSATVCSAATLRPASRRRTSLTSRNARA